ncbi:MAG: MmcB family DNA repair protein [Alphaproteobacteria bacterium]|nr:MmcB family DNA repair protein [Alphaproteobacteria bacterium]
MTPAEAIARGCLRLLAGLGHAPVEELTLANGRRADIAAIAPSGEIVIVEIKSGVPDFRADGKWHDYLDFCDTFYFAVGERFPRELLPLDVGLIIADRFGGTLLRQSPASPLAPARRKAMTARIARVAALKLMRIRDPDFDPDRPEGGLPL